ncbi:MAG: hypothetical protein HKN63_03275 [Rhodobacteraceae bacterium]|nr:hypothetical protein [Paracoccaceae bacterium]
MISRTCKSCGSREVRTASDEARSTMQKGRSALSREEMLAVFAAQLRTTKSGHAKV